MPKPFPSVTRFEALPSDVRAVRDSGPMPEPAHLRDTRRGEVTWFSPASAARLTRLARNAFPALVSQFVLTYHNSNPDGATAKKHLHAWLAALRRAVPGVGYLWVLEFQTRGVPHFHVWLTCEWSEALWKRLGAAWSRIAEPDSPEHLWWHTEPRVSKGGKVQMAYIPWDMGSAGYLRKYMSKEAQKCVPDGFGWVGRFWGSTRGLVPDPVVIEAQEMESGQLYDLTRQLSRWAEARRRVAASKSGRKVRARRARADWDSVWVNSSASVFFELLDRLPSLQPDTG